MGITAVTAQKDQRLASRATLLTVLVSETVFFGTLLVAYVYLRAGQPTWPIGHASLTRLLVPGLNTMVLVLSAIAVRGASLSIQQGEVRALERRLALTLALGLLFVGGQVFEFTRSGMRPNDLAFGGVFFTLMGFHALHVLAGVLILSINFWRARLGDFNADHHIAIEIGAWFWYYVVAVWIALFTALYLV